LLGAAVLERYNVFLSDAEFGSIASRYSRTDGSVDYRPFLDKVMARQSSGAFGPHVPQR
jgi:hypothetical protein